MAAGIPSHKRSRPNRHAGNHPKRPSRTRQKTRAKAPDCLPYTRRNAKMFGAGIGCILAGYLCLAQPPANGLLSLTVAPLLLLAGYGVLIPLALLMRSRQIETE